MPPAAQQQQGGDNSLAPVWITALVIVTLLLIWYGAKEYIVSFVFAINVAQAKLVQLFLGSGVLEKQVYIMQTMNPAQVNWDQLLFLSSEVGDYIRYPVIVCLVALAFLLYFSNITLKFRNRHDMKTLRKQEQFNWPAIMPVLQQDLVSIDINEGPWAMALSPIEFSRKYDLLRKDDELLDHRLPGQELTAAIRRSEAKRVFTLQLGAYWEGFDNCPPYFKALAAVFLARINRDRPAATAILESLDKGYTEGKPNFAQANMVLKKYQNDPRFQEIAAKHAYRLTMIASLLAASRDDGVVPTSEFLWLKVVDRRLWYMLNCVGRQTPYAEVAGAFAHWRAEKLIGRRCLVPMVDEATNALEKAVKEVKLSPKEMEGLKP